MKDISIACLIAYGIPEHHKNIIKLINKLSSLQEKDFKNIKVNNFKINIFIGWNKISGIKDFKYNKQLLKHISLKIIEVPDEYEDSSKAYHTWGHLIKHIDLDNNYYFFFKENYFKKINVNNISIFMNHNILKKFPVVYYETVKNINENFRLKKKALNVRNEFILFPRTQIFLINKDVLQYLLDLDFFFTNKYKRKHRQYDLLKLTIKEFNNYSFILRTCDDEGDKHTIKIEKDLCLNKLK